MAKLTRSQSLSALVDGEPNFSAGPGRFTIGLTSRENTVTTYHLHLSEDEARRFVAFIAERVIQLCPTDEMTRLGRHRGAQRRRWLRLHRLLRNADVGCLYVLRHRWSSPKQVGDLESQQKGCGQRPCAQALAGFQLLLFPIFRCHDCTPCEIHLATAKLAGSDFDGREKSHNAHIWIGCRSEVIEAGLESLEEGGDAPEISEIPARLRRTRFPVISAVPIDMGQHQALRIHDDSRRQSVQIAMVKGSGAAACGDDELRRP
jgi:hypothetical protein